MLSDNNTSIGRCTAHDTLSGSSHPGNPQAKESSSMDKLGYQLDSLDKRDTSKPIWAVSSVNRITHSEYYTFCLQQIQFTMRVRRP